MNRIFLRHLLLLVIAVCCARLAAAQESCRLERAVAPDYGGVMLGMRVEELARMFPGSDALQAGSGTAGTADKPFVASLGMLELAIRREAFRDVGELALTFLEGRLQRIDVLYRHPVPWEGVAEFSAHASKRLAVPADAWGAPASDPKRQSRVLDCRGFSVVVRMDAGGASTLSIVDTTPARPAAAEAPRASPAPATRPRRKRP